MEREDKPVHQTGPRAGSGVKWNGARQYVAGQAVERFLPKPEATLRCRKCGLVQTRQIVGSVELVGCNRCGALCEVLE